MSLSKRYLDTINEQNSPGKCLDCKWNFDDHFFEYCRKHFIEAEQHEEERRAFESQLELENEYWR